MTWLDIAVTATVCVSAGIGCWRGLLQAIIGIAGLLGGLLLAGQFYRQLAVALWPSSGVWSFAAAYAIILLGIIAAAALLATVLVRLVRMTPLGIADRCLGMAMGVLIVVTLWAFALTVLLGAVPGSDLLIADSPVARTIVNWLAAARGLPPAQSYPVQSV